MFSNLSGNILAKCWGIWFLDGVRIVRQLISYISMVTETMEPHPTDWLGKIVSCYQRWNQRNLMELFPLHSALLFTVPHAHVIYCAPVLLVHTPHKSTFWLYFYLYLLIHYFLWSSYISPYFQPFNYFIITCLLHLVHWSSWPSVSKIFPPTVPHNVYAN